MPELSKFLKTTWEASTSEGLSFHIESILSRGEKKETIELDNDGTMLRPKKVFGEDWFQCSECERFPAVFHEMASKNELSHAHIHATDLIMHLSSCPIRKADVRVKVEFDKEQLIEGFLQSDMASLVRPSIWFRFANLCEQMRRLGIPEFHQIFVERVDKVWMFFVNDLEAARQCNLLGIDVMPVQNSDSLSVSRDSLATRVRRLSNDLEGLRRGVLGATHVIPPTFFAKVDKDQENKITLCCGHIVAYSFLCVLADKISFDKDHVILELTLPTGLFKARMHFSCSNEEVVVQENGVTTALPASAVADLVENVCTKFSESFTSNALNTLRKTCIRDLLHQGKYATLSHFFKEPARLLDYYIFLKEQLLTKRLEEIDALLDKMWTTATQTSRDLLEMLESMHKEIEAASMLVFGTLGFEAYLYASRAITTEQLFTLLLVFGMGLVFFILFLDFRMCGISDGANLVIDNLGTVERQVTSVTGLGISSDWKNLPEASFKNLSSRIDTIETMYWAFLTANNIALGYVFYRLFHIGVYWLLGVFSGLALFLLFVGVFVYERRAKQGLSKFKGRTRSGGFFLATSIGSLAGVAAYCILSYLVDIAAVLASVTR